MSFKTILGNFFVSLEKKSLIFSLNWKMWPQKMIKNISLELQEGGANYRVKWPCHFFILRAPGALNTENTV